MIIASIVCAIVFVIVGSVMTIIALTLGFTRELNVFWAIVLLLLGSFNIVFGIHLPGMAKEEAAHKASCEDAGGQIIDRVCVEPLMTKDLG